LAIAISSLPSEMLGLKKIVGQTALINRLEALKDFFVSKRTTPGHILLMGPEGTGKRTIALAFAEELGVPAKLTFARSVERKGDLTAILTSLEANEVLLIEDVCRMRQPLKELLGLALEEFRLDLVIGQGASARIHPFKLNPFTCVGTCLKESDCPLGLRNLFFLKLPMETYSIPELTQIAERIAANNGLTFAPSAMSLIAKMSSGNPRQAEILVRQLSKTTAGTVTERDAEEALSVLGLMSVTTQLSIQPKNLNSLSGVEFEEFITQLLRVMGFQTQMTKASGDGGIDIVAILDKPIIGGRYLFQCKRLGPDSLVGAPTVREFYGAVTADRKASKGILITNSGFSIQAKEFAADVGIELVDGQRLGNLLAEYGNPLEDKD
jgi:Holliday junction resolvasome RuvABC ATP-dependent DNA helicase subunit